MLPLLLTLHIFIGATLSGTLVIAALVAGYVGVTPILVAAAVGFVAAFPVSYLIAKRLS